MGPPTIRGTQGTSGHPGDPMGTHMTPNHGGTHGTSEEPMAPHRHPWDPGDTHRTPNHWGHPGALRTPRGLTAMGGTHGTPRGPWGHPWDL